MKTEFRSTARLIAAAFALIASVAVSGGAWATVINGDFETPLVTNIGPPPGFGFDYRTGGALTGWTIFAPNNGIVQFNSTYQPVGGGLQSIQLEYPGDYVEQSISTISGQKYLLSFDLGAYTPPGTSALQLNIGSDPAIIFAGASAWVTNIVLFTATGASTLIHFENDAISVGTYPHLDNISVNAVSVPEPATLALLGLGLAGLGFSRRKK